MVASVVDGTDDEYNDGDDGSNILEMCSDCEVSTSIGVEGSDLQVLLSSKLSDQSLCVILNQALSGICVVLYWFFKIIYLFHLPCCCSLVDFRCGGSLYSKLVLVLLLRNFFIKYL